MCFGVIESYKRNLLVRAASGSTALGQKDSSVWRDRRHQSVTNMFEISNGRRSSASSPSVGESTSRLRADTGRGTPAPIRQLPLPSSRRTAEPRSDRIRYVKQSGGIPSGRGTLYLVAAKGVPSETLIRYPLPPLAYFSHRFHSFLLQYKRFPIPIIRINNTT